MEKKGTMVVTNMHSGWFFLASFVVANVTSVPTTTNKWRRLDNVLALTRLVSEREFNSQDEGTQALTKMLSDSLSVASLDQEVSLYYITLRGLTTPQDAQRGGVFLLHTVY